MDSKKDKGFDFDVMAEFDKIKANFGKAMSEGFAREEKISVPEEAAPVKKNSIVPDYEPIGLDKTIIPDKPIREQLNTAKPAPEKVQETEEIHSYEDLEDLLAPAPVVLAPEIKTEPVVQDEPTPRKEKKVKSQKKHRKKKYKLNWWKVLRLIIILGLLCCLVVGFLVLRVVKNTPEINPNNIYEMLSENSIMYDRNGELVDNIYAGDALRTNLEYNEMPQDLIQSFVSIEDKTFWKHHGFNIIRIVGAVVDKVTGKSERIGGTSTITQQLARNLYLTSIKGQRSMARKISEAYYTLVLERSLTKEQIIEAYLNTIYLGYNCNGVAAASRAYFNKDVQDLELLECCALASLPKSPNAYAPIKRQETASIEDFDSLDVITKDDDWTTYFNASIDDRIKLVLRFLHEQEKISDETYETAKADTLRNYINPGANAVSTATTSYFVDYVKGQVLTDLQSQLDMSYDEAYDLLYNGGLRINSTMDMKIQNIIESVYSDPANFPKNASYTKDAQGNILDQNRKILLYNVENYFNADGDFVLGADEYQFKGNGDLLVYGGKRLNFYKTSVGGNVDYSAEFKNLYELQDGVLFSRSGGVWNIPAEYKDRDGNGDLTISAAYLESKPEAFTKNADGTLTLSQKYFTLKQPVRQPQSAFVIKDFKTGELLGMVGGRNIEGKLLYNRATSARQPGSSIKPLAIYSVALQKGVEMGGTFTAAMPIDDLPINYGDALWPSNWYVGYKGIQNFRRAVEQSINACAVQLYTQMDDPGKSIEFLQGMGISTLVTDGEINDVNASALALGGMTKGISPIEMCGAYGTIGNYGTYVETIAYTTVTTKTGDVILSKEPYTHQVMDEAVASLMTDILRTTVTNGLGSGARLKSQPSAGKTGTTSDRYDLWFCGLTPQYAASVWIGNDVNLEIGSDSSGATKVWRLIMEQIGELTPREEFQMKGDFVTLTVDRHSGLLLGEMSDEDCALSEKFIKGTEPTTVDESHGYCTVCASSGYLATPDCPSTYMRTGIIRPGGRSWDATLSSFTLSETSEYKNKESEKLDAIPDAVYDLPDLYCPYHNPDTAQYPISKFYEEYSPELPELGETLDDGFGNLWFDDFEGDLNPEVQENAPGE